MSALLVQLAEAAAASYSGADGVLTAEYLQTCQELLPIIGEYKARTAPHIFAYALTVCIRFLSYNELNRNGPPQTNSEQGSH